MYRKKQRPNQRLYYLHLEAVHQYGGMRQHTQEYIDEQINRLMDNIYQKLNKKLDTLTKQANTRQDNSTSTSKFQTRIINLTDVRFTKEHIKMLSLGPNYAMELSTALARTRTLKRSSSITQYKQHDTLPHHHS